MNPVEEHRVIEFLHWLAQHPAARTSPGSLTKQDLLQLAREFEGYPSAPDSQRREWQWQATVDLLLAERPHWNGLDAARNLYRRMSLEDRLDRYRRVPLHGVFLFSSEDSALERHINDNWSALDRMSADHMDIYPSLRQLRHRREDAYTLMNDRARIPGLAEVSVADLPGLLVWTLEGESAYIALRVGENQQREIVEVLREVFGAIRAGCSMQDLRAFADRVRRSQQRSRMVPRPDTKVLFVAANPESTSPLALDEEMREIRRKLRMADDREALVFSSAWAARTEDLLQYMNQERPKIVHFSAHGSKDGELFLVATDGSARAVTGQALERLFTSFTGVELVLLNACYSAVQATAIARVVDTVIGMRAPITNEAATIFASTFYAAIGFAKTYEEAFSQAQTALALDGVDESVPVLIRKGQEAGSLSS